jgi:hypothetical protein
MAKKAKQHAQKSLRKTMLKEVQGKLAESLKEYHKKISEKKFQKKLRKAGKILTDSLAKENITVVPKKEPKEKKVKTAAASELVS